MPPRGRRVRKRTIGCLAAIVVVVLLGTSLVNVFQHVMAFGSAISTQSPLSTQTGYMSGSDRTNVLIMGYGGGSHDGANLTDSMQVISLMPQSHHTSEISIARDLWVQVPPASGNYAKLNAEYATAIAQGKSPAQAGDIAAQEISKVTGLQVKYWVTINFTGFKDLIDSIGGVDVNVPDSFNACYPKNDDAAVDASWIKVQFNKGMQHMDGATAIEYARAREPLEVCGMGTSENLAELTDFGRSARQQLIMQAVEEKFKQIGTWPHLYDAMNALQHAVYTNMSLADLGEFVLHMNLSDPHTARIVLQNVTVNVVEPDGEEALAPPNNDWSVIQNYIQQNLYK
jgi:LCP family protein required for cell wall assembly